MELPPKLKHPLLITRKAVVRGRRKANFLGKGMTKDRIIGEIFSNGKRTGESSGFYSAQKKSKTVPESSMEGSSADLAKADFQPRQSP